ncbi:putative ABC transporter binding protein NosD [freshwater sediment metagenome]|uniref:ABC transporter binding protein NosD n=1 Tax=freshwater sediment metagenome TaxID=556182 RepID=A0AA48M0V3_9ZZZZ
MRRPFTVCVCMAALAVAGQEPAMAAVRKANVETLTAVLAKSTPGDTVELAPGVYPGPLAITRPLTIKGQAGVVIDGGGKGRVIEVLAQGVRLAQLTVRHSGLDLAKMDAGVFLDRVAKGATVEDLVIEDNLIGVMVWGAEDSVIRRNVIRGRSDLRTSEAGNGVYVWNAPGARIEDNDITFGQDGIFVTSSRRNVFRNNFLHNVRFAIHYMYTHDSEVSLNRSRGNHSGFALMYSDRLLVRGNRSEGDRDEGILLNYANRSTIEENAVVGAEKCVFIYNANFNRFRRNRFEGCEIGVHFTAGSAQNVISENAFIDNRNQVKYVGTRALDWSDKRRGNYWSDNPAFDLDKDGIADVAYRPNDLVDRVVWLNPAAKLLLNSPAVSTLRWAQAQFPALHPGGVIDSAPLMTPPRIAAAAPETKP